MEKVTLLCAGKLKEKYWRDAAAEYVKRLSAYCNLDILEIKDEKTQEHMSPAEEDALLLKEAEQFLKKLDERAYVIALDIKGAKMGSEELADRLERLVTGGSSRFVFLIGSSVGLHDTVLKKADMRLSFSDLTFPHQLARIMLLEQLYRGYRIRNGEPYHK